MVDRFRQFLTDNGLWHPGERMLLAVSGGVDSVVMAHLFRRAGIPAGIGHCNFQLRGAASDGDADFVGRLAGSLGIPFHQAAFATGQIATQRGISIQMAARELRYTWLEQVRQEQGYFRIATGHHLNDTIETVLFNFAKGCGLRGLQGIPLLQGSVVRPLLFATRTEIEEFATGEGLDFREDASNREDKYARNFVRHQIIPRFRELNPSFDLTAAGNVERMHGALELYEYALEQVKRKIVQVQGDRQTIDLGGLLAGPAPATVLFELLHPLGFSAAQVSQVLDSRRQPGALFFSGTHQLVVDRETLIIDVRINHGEDQVFLLTAEEKNVTVPGGSLEWAWKAGRPPLFFDDPYRATLDAGLLQFPLHLRHWREGDVFHPLGMQGKRKKLQDFFTDQKVSRADKERIWLLANGDGEICWVVGHRIDDRFKITGATRNYLSLVFRKSSGDG